MLVDMLLSLLPARYWRGRRTNALAGTFRSGVATAVALLAVYILLFFRFLDATARLAAATLPGDMQHDQYMMSFGLGALSWVAFAISPGPLLVTYFMVEGAVRAVSAGVCNEPMASLPLWLLGRCHDLAERKRAERRLAPLVPDVVETAPPGEGWDLLVTSVRKKQDWTALVQIEYGGAYYLIARSEEAPVAGSPRFRYYLRKAKATEGYRGIVRYDPFQT
jgi:hypothetical protein